MPVAWLPLFLVLSDQYQPWPLPPAAPALEPVSSTRTLTGEELLRIGETHDSQRHFPETLMYYQLALTSFREKKQARGIATVLVKIAQVYERQGKMPEASEALQEALPILARSSDRLAHARALLVMGRVSAWLGDREEARSSLSQAAALFDRAKERSGWNESLVQLGLLEVGDGSTEEGLSMLQQAWTDARAREDRSQQAASLTALGTAQWLLDHPADARRYYEDGLQLAVAEHYLPLEAALRFRLASLDGEAQQLSKAVESAQRASLLARTLRDPGLEAAVSSLLADLYRQMGRDTEADEAIQRALLIYRYRQIQVHGTP